MSLSAYFSNVSNWLFHYFPPRGEGRLSVPVTSYELGKYTYMFAFLNKLQQSSVDLTHLDLEIISSLDIVHCTGTDNMSEKKMSLLLFFG